MKYHLAGLAAATISLVPLVLSAQTPSSPAPIQITRPLSLGASGQDVAALQRYLTQTGDFTYPEITGYFGPITQTAVQSFQTRMGIVSSGTPATTGYGFVGPRTRAALANPTVAGGGNTAAPGTLTAPSTPTDASAPVIVENTGPTASATEDVPGDEADDPADLFEGYADEWWYEDPTL